MQIYVEKINVIYPIMFFHLVFNFMDLLSFIKDILIFSFDIDKMVGYSYVLICVCLPCRVSYGLPQLVTLCTSL